MDNEGTNNDSTTKSDTIESIMTRKLITVNPTTTVFQIAKMMEQANIGTVVVKENDKYVGIMTDRDFATKITAENMPFDTPVQKVMSSPLITIGHDKSMSTAATMMKDKRIRKLAVSENGSIVGIVTATDIVSKIAR